MSPLAKYLEAKGYVLQYFDDVLHAKNKKSKDLDIFLFPFGCAVIWSAIENNKDEVILNELKKFQVDPVKKPAVDFIYFEYDKDIKKDDYSKTFIEEEQNKIILGSKSEYLKLSISHALAQSAKLNVLEESVSSMLERVTPIQKELAATGRIALSQKELSKNIGVLFSERFSINLHSDILDTPEFFWRKPSYEPLYLVTAEFQDISVRHGILNHRLNIIQELYSILSSELSNKHSSRLEIIIILLITIEVVLGLMHEDIPSKLWNFFF